MIDTNGQSSSGSNKLWRLEINCHNNCTIAMSNEEKGSHFLCHSSHLLLSSTMVTSSVGSSWRFALCFPRDAEFEGTKRQQVMRKGWVCTGGSIDRKFVIHRNDSWHDMWFCIAHRELCTTLRNDHTTDRIGLKQFYVSEFTLLQLGDMARYCTHCLISRLSFHCWHSCVFSYST